MKVFDSSELVVMLTAVRLSPPAVRQVRHEKDVVRRNRLRAEQEFEQQRANEFQIALDREKVSLLFF